MPQYQHVDLHRKILMRQRLLRAWEVRGAAYVPFIGDGDLAAQLYADRVVYGADIDAARVEVAAARVAGRIIVADCDQWPFYGEKARFGVADFDAYTYPYHSFRAFWAMARKQDVLVVFFTDTVKQAVKRGGHVHHPDGSMTELPPLPSRRRSAVYNSWFSRYLWPWFEAYIPPYRVLDRMRYLRQDTVYWGAVLQRMR
jgi:hypothetical protein